MLRLEVVVGDVNGLSSGTCCTSGEVSEGLALDSILAETESVGLLTCTRGDGVIFA